MRKVKHYWHPFFTYNYRKKDGTDGTIKIEAPIDKSFTKKELLKWISECKSLII